MRYFLLIAVMIFFTSCQGAKDALGGKTRSDNSDEFLVEKKNPLSMPPDFDELPIPENSIINENEQEDQTLKNKLKVSSSKKNTTLSNSSKDQTTSSIEKNILEKINN